MGGKRWTRKREKSIDLRRSGLKAFEQGDYSEAIEIWKQVKQQPRGTLPTSALAEAYFRRGLDRLHKRSEIPGGLNDLERATALQAEESRYTYHLGLALHRQGDLDGAICAYQIVREEDGEFAERTAYPLALALLQQGDDPADASVWSDLSHEERAMLNEVSTFRRRPYALPDAAPLLWRGIAAVDAGDDERAQAALESTLENAHNSAERQLAHYYQGVLAARQEDWDEACRRWTAAYVAEMRTPRMEDNLHEAYHRLAEELLEQGDVKSALAAGEEALRHGPSYPSLEALVSQAHQRLAHEAVSDGEWAEAREHWKAADAVEGGSFRLAYNLALAHERSEDFLAAGERWREALRHRPRSDDHPDAITDDQVARLWQRAAEAYTKAGEYDEAVQVYRNAVKWNPDRLEARLALSEALLLNGQTEAAENELNRVLDRDPDNVSALLRLGEVVYARGHWWRGSPTRYWERALELEPDNATARQSLIDFYHDQAEDALYWGNYPRALDMYRQALEYQPDNARILAALGACYLRMDEMGEAHTYLDQALKNTSDDLMVYDEIIQAWFDVDDPDEAWRVLERAESAIENIPYEFYIHQGGYCIDYADEIVRPWLKRAVEKAPSGEPVLAAIGEMLVMNGAFDLAREYLERAIEADQQPGQAHLMLGIVALQEGNSARAEMHWSDAMKIARRTNDEELRERVERARLLFSMPPGMLDLIGRFGPGAFDDAPFPDFS